LGPLPKGRDAVPNLNLKGHAGGGTVAGRIHTQYVFLNKFPGNRHPHNTVRLLKTAGAEERQEPNRRSAARLLQLYNLL